MANSPRTPRRCFVHSSGRAHALDPASRPEIQRENRGKPVYEPRTTWRKERNGELQMSVEGCESSATRGFGSDEFLDQKLRQARGVMPDHPVLFEPIVQHAAHADRLQFLYIHEHRGGSARAIAARDFWRNYLFACDNPVEQFAPRVFVNHA